MEKHNFKQRLLAVMDYDGIAPDKRVAHLARSCAVSISTARRMLGGNYDIRKARGHMVFDIADGLNVHWRWIYDGLFQMFDSRTARIELVMINGEVGDMADSIIQSVCKPVPVEPEYIYLGNDPKPLNLVLLVEQHRRMSKWEKNKNLRLMIRLGNNDPKASRLLDMCSRGQISKQQLFSMV